METRYGHPKMGDKQKQYVHMLNATLTATERTICCILENYQTPTGVVVPRALRKYMNGLEFMPYVKELPSTKGKQKSEKGPDGGSKGGQKGQNPQGQNQQGQNQQGQPKSGSQQKPQQKGGQKGQK